MKRDNGLEEERRGKRPGKVTHMQVCEYRKNVAGINHTGDCLSQPPLLSLHCFYFICLLSFVLHLTLQSQVLALCKFSTVLCVHVFPVIILA